MGTWVFVDLAEGGAGAKFLGQERANLAGGDGDDDARGGDFAVIEEEAPDAVRLDAKAADALAQMKASVFFY